MMEKDTLQIDPWASWDLERNFETFEAENGHTDESVRGAVKDGNFANDGTKVGKVRGAFRLPLPNFIHFGTSQG